jgi:dTMP kinase
VGIDRLESESRSFHERVRYAFLDLAATDPKRYLVLDGARPPEEIAGAVAQRVTGLLAVHTSHPASGGSTGAPPGPDLAAPDLDARPPGAGQPHLAPPHGAMTTDDTAGDATAALEGMAKLVGIDDEGADRPTVIAEDGREVGRHHRS